MEVEKVKKPGEILKEFRIKEGLSGANFGEVIGCSQQQVSRLEKDERGYSEKILEILKNYMPENYYQDLITSIEFYKLPESYRERILNSENTISFFPDIKASAGFGALNYESSTLKLEVPKKFAKKGNIAVKVKGDSMFPAFYDNDIIVIDTVNNELENNKIYVFNYQGEIYIKKIFFKNGELYIESFNREYPIKRITCPDELKIIGKVLLCYREF